MGSWSEGCGISGMEVREQRACFAMMIVQDKYEPENYNIVCPPIRGTYNDYGRMIVHPDDLPLVEMFDVALDNNEWEPREQRSMRDIDNVAYFWIDGSVLDMLGSLPREWASSGDGTVRGDWNEVELRLRDAIDKAKNTSGPAYYLAAMNLYQMVRPSMLVNFDPLADAAIAADRTEHLIEAVRRCFMVKVGMMELRKILAPQIGARGPQHGGHEALISFYEQVLGEAKSRIHNHA